MHPKQQGSPLRRLLQFVLIVALLFSGTGLSASSMTCCAGQVHPSMLPAHPAAHATESDGSGMHCHHAIKAANGDQGEGASHLSAEQKTEVRCAPAFCAMRMTPPSNALQAESESGQQSLLQETGAVVFLAPASQRRFPSPPDLRPHAAGNTATLPLRI